MNKQWVVCAVGIGSVFSSNESAHALNISVTRGWPCNIWMQHSGAPGAALNFARFNAKDSPTTGSLSPQAISGATSDYLVSLGRTFSALVGSLPFVEPIEFNLASDRHGAALGVDVCIPQVDANRDDPVDWTVKVTSIGALIPPPQGDWFTQTTPTVSMTLHASNCNFPRGSNMSTATPVNSPLCVVNSSPTPSSLNAVGQTLEFSFKLMANREAVLRFAIQEQGTNKRLHDPQTGTVQIELQDDPLPPLLVGDLLDKTLFFAPDTDYVRWPDCQNFSAADKLAFSSFSLQGPEKSLNLSWKGNDVDCGNRNNCNGNVSGNNFDFPVSVYLANGLPAPPDADPLSKVGRFTSRFDDFAFSGESFYPSHADLLFDANQTDIYQVYRDGDRSFYSATVSRIVGPGLGPGLEERKTCRVWFKRSQGYRCETLPNDYLYRICLAAR